MLRGVLIVGWITSGLVGCGSGSGSDSSELAISKGRPVLESFYPSVVKIQAMGGGGQCTGSFITDSLVLTAAHCFDGMDNIEDPWIYVASIDSNGQRSTGAQALRFERHPLYTEGAVSPYDLALIEFAPGTAPEVLKVSERPAEAGDAVMLLGYGDNVCHVDNYGDVEGEGSGQKRMGTNTISGYAQGMLKLEGELAGPYAPADGQLSCSGEGDSGGPLLVDDKMVGVNFGGGFRRKNGQPVSCFSYYIDLADSENRAFVASRLAN